MASLLLLPYAKADNSHNHVNIDQVNSGDNFNLSIDQVGYENLARFSFNHDNNTVKLMQEGNHMYFGYTDSWGSGYSWGGDIDGLRNEIDVRQKCSVTACNDNDFQFHILGDDNKVVFGQGYQNNDSLTPNWNYDNNEPGGNFVRLDIHGDNNEFKGSQKMDTNTTSHSITANIYTDNNDVYIYQGQNGNKTFTMTVRNSNGNTLDVIQKDNGAHTATVDLLGSQPTTLNLTQQGNTTQSYSLSQNCITVGGCSVSVTQGN
mgnify:FL=1|jgi:hypothetical protein